MDLTEVVRLTQAGVETWFAWIHGTPAGYAELHAQSAGHVEIASFGLLPCVTGQGLGGHLLTFALEQAWTIAQRWPGQPPTNRVWLHTCSLDSPHALHTYQSQGLGVYRVETEIVRLPAQSPGP